MYNQDYDGNNSDPTAATPWWEGPPPAGYTGPWPPALPPGAHYGSTFGSIVYDNPGAPGSPTVHTGDVFDPNTGTFGPPPANTTDNTTTAPTTTNTGGSTPPPTNTQTSNNPGIPTATNPVPTSGAPTYTPPKYTAPPPEVAPPAFSYADFIGPDPSALQNDPVYQYTLKT